MIGPATLARLRPIVYPVSTMQTAQPTLFFSGFAFLGFAFTG
jgi:hypothetical protein